jgi:DNA-binding beta-propeller fold protein YncE
MGSMDRASNAFDGQRGLRAARAQHGNRPVLPGVDVFMKGIVHSVILYLGSAVVVVLACCKSSPRSAPAPSASLSGSREAASAPTEAGAQAPDEPHSSALPRYPRAAASTVRRGHAVPPSGHALVDVAYRPDGSRVATAGVDEKILVWDVDTWQIAEEIPAGTSSASIEYRSDGSLLMCGKGPGLHAWDEATRAWVKLLNEPFPCTALAVVSEFGIYVTSQQFVLFEAATGTVKSKQRIPYSFSYWAAALNPDASLVAVTGGGGAFLINPTTGTKVKHIPLHPHRMLPNGLQFSPDGKHLAVAQHLDGVRLLDVHTWDVVREIPLRFVGQEVWIPDASRLVAATDLSGTGTITWFDGSSFEVIHSEKLANSPFRLLVTTDGGTLVTANLGGSIRFWDAHSGALLATVDASP